ncbi:hypothetical protein Bpla01_54700 [Burkholderia plantarii]|nr:AraC family transcriptional regulator [Burkholderia plantarii]GLZ21941.1 hypothetical protein Bpla01_54700 [Burkholderia plantarii]
MPAATPPASPRLSPDDLTERVTRLEIRVIGLSECIVSEGVVLELDDHDAPGMHHILSGSGLLHIAGAGTVPLAPHTLQFEAPANRARIAPLRVTGREHRQVADPINRFRAGASDPMTVMIRGDFHAAFGAAIDLLDHLSAPIVEHVDASDRLDVRLRAAFDEPAAQEIGARDVGRAAQAGDRRTRLTRDPTARPRAGPSSSLRLHANRHGSRHHPRGTAVRLAGTLEGTDRGRHAARRYALRVGLPAVRPGPGRGARRADRSPDPARARTAETVRGDGRLVARPGADVQRPLHLGGEVPTVDAIYAECFGAQPPARIFVNVPARPGRFDIEIDCIAAV